MKVHPLAVLTGALISLASPTLTQALDNLVIDPTPGTPPSLTNKPELTLQGLIIDQNDTSSGLLITHVDDDGASFGLTERVSVGNFVLRRPIGLYQWKFSDAPQAPATVGLERLAMTLNNDHSLRLHSGDPADAAGDLHALELRPGASGGVYLNDVPLITPLGTVLPVSLQLGGGTLGHGDFVVPSHRAAESQSPGLLAAGLDARAFGDDAVAIGPGSRASFHSVAMGQGSIAYHHSFAAGVEAFADSHATALGRWAYAGGPGAVAIGEHTYAANAYSLGLGASGVADGYCAVGVGGQAVRAFAWAGAFGRAEAEESIAFGGNTYGFRSFAAQSGVTWGVHSLAIGRGAVAEQNYQTVLGHYNSYLGKLWGSAPEPTDPTFVIGNGWIENENTPQQTEIRSNAFTVRHNGDTWIMGGLTVEGTALVRDSSGVGSTVQPAPSTFKGDLSLQAGFTVEGGTPEAPTTSVFKRDVSVQGVLRVPESGDLSMGSFTGGTPP